MSNDIVYYKLVKETIPYNPDAFVTAAVWSCALCDETISGHSGPGCGEICVQCAIDIRSNKLKYKREL
jgi:hypothetical protein